MQYTVSIYYTLVLAQHTFTMHAAGMIHSYFRTSVCLHTISSY